MDTAKPKGVGKWQATLQIQEGSSKLTVKMPFNKSNSSSEGAELKDGKDKKQKNNKNVQQSKDDKKKSKCKNETEMTPEVTPANKRQKVTPQ